MCSKYTNNVDICVWGVVIVPVMFDICMWVVVTIALKFDISIQVVVNVALKGDISLWVVVNGLIQAGYLFAVRYTVNILHSAPTLWLVRRV